MPGPGKSGMGCSIYDVTGRHITVLPMAPSDSGTSVLWDGTDPEGRALPPGVYYARVNGRKQLEHKIILIR